MEHRRGARRLAGVFWSALVNWFGDRAPSSGAAIAYYTLFALAPVLLLVIAIAGAVLGEEAVRGEIATQLSGLVGREGAEAIQGILQRATNSDEATGASVAGAVGLLLAATGAFLELQDALNRVWRVRSASEHPNRVREILRRRLRSLAMVVFLAFLLLVSLSVSAAIGAVSAWFGAYVTGWPRVLLVVNVLFSIGVKTLLFGALFVVLPEVRIRWRDVAIGALLTAILFEAGQHAIGAYIGRGTLTSPFGAAGSVAVILVWVYYSTQIVLYGASFTRQWTIAHARTVTARSGMIIGDETSRSRPAGETQPAKIPPKGNVEGIPAAHIHPTKVLLSQHEE
jgi:membrane protein